MPDQMRKQRDREIQQMFNLDDEQTVSHTSLMDTDDEEIIMPVENWDGLNL